jgi:hypothetical protein
MMAAIHNWLGLYVDLHRCQIDCNQLGLCADEYIIKLIAISFDRVSLDVDGGFDGCLNGRFNGGFYGWFDGGFDGWFNLAMLGYRPQQSV